jgi:WD40 repeat protein
VSKAGALAAACVLASPSAATAAGPVAALAFSPDGSALAVAAGGGVELRSPRDGSVLRRIPYDLARIMAVAFHPRAQVLAAGGGAPGESGAVVLADWRTGAARARLDGAGDVITGVVYGAEGSLLAAASADGSVRVLRTGESGAQAEEAFRLAGHTGPVLAVAFSLDGKLLVTAGADRSVKVWSADGGTLLRSLNHHGGAVHALAFRPAPPGEAAGAADAETAVCATGSDDRTVRVWQPASGRMVRIVRRHEGAVLALAYARDGESLYSAGAEGILRRIDAASDEVRGEWPAGGDWIYALALSPDGKTLASGDWAGGVKLWEVGKEGLKPAPGAAAQPRPDRR